MILIAVLLIAGTSHASFTGNTENSPPSPSTDTTNQTTAESLVPLLNLTSSVEISSTLMQGLRSQLNIDIDEAVRIAINAVGQNASAMSGYIHPERESFVFRVFVIDADNNIRMVVVDPGNGNVLLSQQIAPNPTNRIIENKTRFITSAIDGNDNQLTNNGTTTSRSITFHFEQQAGADFFRCEIDNQIKSCTSPLTLSNLTIGGHLFRIYIYHTSGLMEKS